MRKDISYYANNWDALGGSLKWADLTPEQRNRSIAELDRLEAEAEQGKTRLAELERERQRLEIEHAVWQERLRGFQEQNPAPGHASRKLF